MSFRIEQKTGTKKKNMNFEGCSIWRSFYAAPRFIPPLSFSNYRTIVPSVVVVVVVVTTVVVVSVPAVAVVVVVSTWFDHVFKHLLRHD